MGLGKRYWSARVADLSEDQLNPIRDYLEDIKSAVQKGLGLFLWGDNSLGKTYIASALCKYVWGMYRVSSYLITASTLYSAMKKDQPAHEGSAETVMQRVRFVRFLVIDDLGREYRAQSGFLEAELSSLIRDRIREAKTTVITSNVHPGKVKDTYGKSLSELCKEAMHIAQVTGENRRETGQTTLKKRLE